MILTLGIVAGEASGDNLAAGCMVAMRKLVQAQGRYEDIKFVGIGGPRMCAAGLHSLASMDQLSVNGFRDPIVRLPQLVRLLRMLIRELDQRRIDGFLGVDFNVFNFILEKALKKRGIKTAHYVSPSVYAWRTGRTKKVAKSTDLLLCLYPFEPEFYQHSSVQAEFVGHPLADEIEISDGLQQAKLAARRRLGVGQEATVLAVLPGSRSSEVKLMMPHFAQALDLFSRQHSEVCVVIPCLRDSLRVLVEKYLGEQSLDQALHVVCYDGNARDALTSADIALVKAGTSTLEAMLLKCPMVVSYRLGMLTYQFAKRVLRTPYVALPNILAGRALVPELLQHAGSGANLAQALSEQLHKSKHSDAMQQQFVALHQQLKQAADAKSAAAVLGLLASSA